MWRQSHQTQNLDLQRFAIKLLLVKLYQSALYKIIHFSPSKSLDDALLGTLAPEGVEEAVEAEPRESPRRSVSRVLELFTRPTLGLAATGLTV